MTTNAKSKSPFAMPARASGGGKTALTGTFTLTGVDGTATLPRQAYLAVAALNELGGKASAELWASKLEGMAEWKKAGYTQGGMDILVHYFGIKPKTTKRGTVDYNLGQWVNRADK